MPGPAPRRSLDDAMATALLEEALGEAARTGRVPLLVRGLLTKGERRMLAHRLWVAVLLREGYSYRGIEDRTGASSATIAGVDRWLRQENPAYRTGEVIRHRGGVHRTRGRFSDEPPPLSPWNVRGRINLLFGMDPRQRSSREAVRTFSTRL